MALYITHHSNLLLFKMVPVVHMVLKDVAQLLQSTCIMVHYRNAFLLVFINFRFWSHSLPVKMYNQKLKKPTKVYGTETDTTWNSVLGEQLCEEETRAVCCWNLFQHVTWMTKNGKAIYSQIYIIVLIYYSIIMILKSKMISCIMFEEELCIFLSKKWSDNIFLWKH